MNTEIFEALTLRNIEMLEAEPWFSNEVIGTCEWCDDGITQATRTWHQVPVCRECHIEAYLPENHNR